VRLVRPRREAARALPVGQPARRAHRGALARAAAGAGRAVPRARQPDAPGGGAQGDAGEASCGMTRELLVVAVEASADLHGAAVLRELRALRPGLRAFGAGGPLLRAARRARRVRRESARRPLPPANLDLDLDAASDDSSLPRSRPLAPRARAPSRLPTARDPAPLASLAGRRAAAPRAPSRSPAHRARRSHGPARVATHRRADPP